MNRRKMLRIMGGALPAGAAVVLGVAAMPAPVEPHKPFNDGEVLTAARLNAEFSRILEPRFRRIFDDHTK